MDEPQKITLTRAVTHIPLFAVHASKRAALDALWEAYRPLCEQYAQYFCSAGYADAFAEPIFPTVMSERWQRVAIQQAAGIAKSWLSNRQNHYEDYCQRKAYFDSLSKAEREKRKAPEWQEPNLPIIHNICIQANKNVVLTHTEAQLPIELEAADKGLFDYWLRVSTLEKRHTIYVPVKLANYHRKVLEGQRLNASVTLNRDKHGKWRLTFSYDVVKDKPKRSQDAPVVGVDIGISNFITTSTGKQYGTFKQDLAAAHQRDRLKRQRKAKLRACLEKQGVEKLPSTTSATGQRLSRRVKQEINRAVNQCLDDHPDHHLVMERLNVGGMRFKTKQMNAYLYASNLGYIPKQLEAKAMLRGVTLTKVNPAYSSQQCSHCHYTHRDNRPSQQTFCCRKCGFTAHADVNASVNVLNRLDDRQLARCKGLPAVKQLLDKRHKLWCQQNGYS